jgi:Outer membrane protein beta-barrel domain
MRTSMHHWLCWQVVARSIVGAMLLVGMLMIGVRVAGATELIPSIGVTKPVHDSNADAQVYGGLALRGNILPLFKSEIGAAYRSESRLNNTLTVRQWPVTGSLWLAPIPALYAGGGVGWYHTTFDYDASVPLVQDNTKSQFGVHLGGGFEVPLGPAAALDLNGRYVFLDKANSNLPPQQFDPDFWSTTLGLAIRF